MARPPKGKPLTLRPIRLDDDVWAECQRLGKEHGTINEGLSAAQAALQMQEAQGRVVPETVKARMPQSGKRRPRQKEDKTR